MKKRHRNKTSQLDAPQFSPNVYSETQCNVVIVYDDVQAGRRAVRSLSQTERELNAPGDLYPLLWRFDLLDDPDWRALATADALKADLLILSATNPGDLPSSVQSWIQGCLAQKRGTDAAVVVLFGEADKLPETDLPRFQLVKSAASEAGLDFFAPGAY